MQNILSDSIARINNGQKYGFSKIELLNSTILLEFLKVLYFEGFIRGFERYNVRTGIDEIRIELKYFEGKPVIQEINRISRPGCRVYSKIKDLPKVYNGLGISILSTPRGVMSDAEAREANVGGEVLCQVF